jgi:anaerobic ribonucleoside-triphosphate reductase activating protein
MSEDDKNVECLIDNTDILIDGQFVLGQKDLTLQFRGSQNQRVIDLNKTRENGGIVLWKQA